MTMSYGHFLNCAANSARVGICVVHFVISTSMGRTHSLVKPSDGQRTTKPHECVGLVVPFTNTSRRSQRRFGGRRPKRLAPTSVATCECSPASGYLLFHLPDCACASRSRPA